MEDAPMITPADLDHEPLRTSPRFVPTPEPVAQLDRLGDQIAELSAHLDAATARLLDLIREFDERGGWNNGPLVRRVADVAHRARSWRRARAGPRGPRAGDTAAAGTGAGAWRIVVFKMRALTRVATPETEARLLAVGRAGTAKHVELIVR